MTGGLDPVADVQAPIGALAWSPSSGWLTDTHDVVTHNDVMWVVDDDGVVPNVTGAATLAVVMHLDRRITALHREVAELRGRL